MSDDNQITAAARKVVTSNWFDVSQIRIRTVRGVVHLQGHVVKTDAGKTDLKRVEGSLRKLDDSLRALRGFRGVAYGFDNWQREGTGGWRFIGSRAERDEAKGKR